VTFYLHDKKIQNDTSIHNIMEKLLNSEKQDVLEFSIDFRKEEVE